MDTLQTDRLIIRPWQITDSTDLYEYAKNPTLGPQAGWKPHKNEEESRKVIIDFMKRKDTWAIELKEAHKVIGSISLMAAVHSQVPHDCELEFVVSSDYSGNGYATEACKRVTEYAFDVFQIRNLLSSHIEGNVQARRVLEKCGFRYYRNIANFLEKYDGVKATAEVYLLNYVDYQRQYK